MAFFNPQSREIEKKNLLNLWIFFFILRIAGFFDRATAVLLYEKGKNDPNRVIIT
jgi:hypothetical protein